MVSNSFPTNTHGRRVCIVSHRLGGHDGVSVEAAKWHVAFTSLGWGVTRAAGAFVDTVGSTDVEVAGLWARYPGTPPPAADVALISNLCRTHDLLVLDNVGSLPTAPAAAIEFETAALTTSTPTIVRHHDPAWQTPRFTAPDARVFPLHHPGMMHVTINTRTAGEFLCRYPDLGAAGAITTVYNSIELQSVQAGEREATRQRMNIGRDDVLIGHPARNIARKNIPAALRLAAELHRRLRRPIHYWLTDPGGDVGEPPAGVTVHRGWVGVAADLYAAADLIALPSDWEGFGLPVIEAAAALRPTATHNYPVLAELHRLGLRTLDHTDPDAIAALLSDTAAYQDLTTANRHAIRGFDINGLPALVAEIACRAEELMEALPTVGPPSRAQSPIRPMTPKDFSGSRSTK